MTCAEHERKYEHEPSSRAVEGSSRTPHNSQSSLMRVQSGTRQRKHGRTTQLISSPVVVPMKDACSWKRKHKVERLNPEVMSLVAVTQWGGSASASTTLAKTLKPHRTPANGCLVSIRSFSICPCKISSWQHAADDTQPKDPHGHQLPTRGLADADCAECTSSLVHPENPSKFELPPTDVLS